MDWFHWWKVMFSNRLKLYQMKICKWIYIHRRYWKSNYIWAGISVHTIKMLRSVPCINSNDYRSSWRSTHNFCDISMRPSDKHRSKWAERCCVPLQPYWRHTLTKSIRIRSQYSGSNGFDYIDSEWWPTLELNSMHLFEFHPSKWFGQICGTTIDQNANGERNISKIAKSSSGTDRTKIVAT